jgi:DNA-binding MarR family transcriptional regulator
LEGAVDSQEKLYSHPDFIKQDKNIEEDGTVSGTVNPTQRKILEEIEKTNSLTYEQLAERLKKGRTTIYRNIKKMVELNIIKRTKYLKLPFYTLQNDF